MKKETVTRSSKRSVTFELAGVEAEKVSVVGEFNNWDPSLGAMKRRKDGVWTKAVRLEPGTYRYRYVADETRWINDPLADGYEPSGFGEDNCLVKVD